MANIEENAVLVVNPEPKHAGGRPSKYRKEYAEMILSYFRNLEPNRVPTEEVWKMVTDENGNQVQVQTSAKYKVMGYKLPHFTVFAERIGHWRDTVRHWAYLKRADGTLAHPEFSRAYKECKHIQKQRLIDGGVSGEYNATFTIFTAKNITNMRDKIEVDNTHKFGAMTDEDLDNNILDKVLNIIK